MDKLYPDKLIRGISSFEYIDEEGRVSAQAFQFDDKDRDDDYSELSINWYDDPYALDKLLSQIKQGSDDVYQFKAGAAIMKRDWLDEVISRPNTLGALSYERKEIDGNPYHGNLLRKKGLSKTINTMLSSALAMTISGIVRRG